MSLFEAVTASLALGEEVGGFKKGACACVRVWLSLGEASPLKSRAGGKSQVGGL